jgi:hypothetical protein
VKTLLRRFLAAVTHSGPGYTPAFRPARGDAVEAWLKAARDVHSDRYGVTPAWFILDDVLDTYRLHADTGTALTDHVCEGRMAGDCDCLETAS